MTKLLHIGLGKCGSVFTTKNFSKLEKKISTSYIVI